MLNIRKENNVLDKTIDNNLLAILISSDMNVELCIKIMDLLLKYSININEKDNDGNNCLHIACKKDDIDILIIQLLIDHGININEKNNNGDYCFDIACKNQNIKCFELFLKYNAKSNIENPYLYVDIDTMRNYIKSIENINIDIIIKYFNIKVTYKFETDLENEDVCGICLINNINCQTICGHKYCVNCYLVNVYSYENLNCAMCRTLLTDEIIIYK
jgi:ankyrin repeat protein